MSHPELAAEQAYVDRAYEQLERMRQTVAGAADTADGEVAALALEAWARRRLRTFEDADRGLCFGRLDLEGDVRPLYVGRRWVHDEGHEILVVNWQAPAARPFYTATPVEPQRVRLRRRFRTHGRRLLGLSDETLDGTQLEGAAVSDFLLEELERTREGRMRDIVATIQADQYRLITADPKGALVVQGGPGTGKTAVGLHRASWLLYTHRRELGRRGVLVVGPNPTFMDYVSHVLPSLGEDAVEQRAVGELLDGVGATREEATDVARLKGDLRLAEVVSRAVERALVRAPEPLVLTVDGAIVSVEEPDVAALLEEALASADGLQPAKERFRSLLLRRFYARYARRLGGEAYLGFDELEAVLRRGGFLTRYLDRVLRLPKPDALVRRLLTSPTALADAGEGVLEPAELRLLLQDRPRRAAELEWSVHDLPLLDEARALVEGPPRRSGHVIVDEAQDLSPMQLRMVARRAAHGLTILGDVAQGTGPVAYAGWDELAAHLPAGVDVRVEELRHAYRVPAEIMELSLPLLDLIAPRVERPLAYRTGAAPPRGRRVEAGALLAEALREAGALAEQDGLIAVIAPASLAAEAPAADAFDETSIPVLTARSAKGLEFDHVVVVEPAAIVEEAGEQGLRELYVALTRPTRTLVVVHARPLPAPLRAL
ncbi:MAG TPA: AAA family ATPase [Gaiellaceae bacterium]|nr:AAA family ATPase [Gaiellaceae bacterium]